MSIENIVRQVVDQLGANNVEDVANKDTEAILRAAKSEGSGACAPPEKREEPAEAGSIANIVRQVVSQLDADDAKHVDVESIIRSAQANPEASPAAQAACLPGGADLANYLEHALLIPDIRAAEIANKCALARKSCIAAVCVAPYYVAEAAEVLRGSTVAVGSAVGIPNAAMSTAAKLADIRDCINNGATELDVALNNLAIKSGRIDDALKELDAVMELALGKAVIKAAFEHCLFTQQEKEDVLQMLKRSGIEYVKIQNALSGQPAKEEDILFVRQVLGNNAKIKIDGGVKTAQRVRELVGAGASRIGTSATFDILK